MEPVKNDLQVRPDFTKGFLKIGIHIASHDLHILHPVKPYMAYEVIHDVFLLPLLYPDDVSSLQIDYGGGVPMEPMQGELVDSNCLSFRFFQLPVHRVQSLQTFPVYVSDHPRRDPCDLSDFLVLQARGQKPVDVFFDPAGDAIMGCKKRNLLHGSLFAPRAEELMLVNENACVGIAERNVLQQHVESLMQFHVPSAAGTDPIFLGKVQVSVKQMCLHPGSRDLHFLVVKDEIWKQIWNHPKISEIST